MKRSKAILLSFLSIFILILSQTAANIVSGLLLRAGMSVWLYNIPNSIVYLTLTFVFLKLLIEKIMHLSLSDFGISRFSVKPRWLLAGLLLPVLVSLCYLLFFSGEYFFSTMSVPLILSVLGKGVFMAGLGAGFVEEMVFRGVLFHSLEKAWNTRIAVILPSVLFGTVHILGMNFSPLSCALVILAGTAVGIMFSMITVESGSVWSSGTVHALWNIIIIGGILSIGTNPDGSSMVSYVLSSRAFAVTGGEFGIESSVISLIGYIIVSIAAYLMIRKKKAE